MRGEGSLLSLNGVWGGIKRSICAKGKFMVGPKITRFMVPDSGAFPGPFLVSSHFPFAPCLLTKLSTIKQT